MTKTNTSNIITGHQTITMQTAQTVQVDLFAESFKSAQTKKVYTFTLNKFVRDNGFTDLCAVEPKIIQNKLIEHVIKLKKAGRSYSRQNSYICSVKAYCEAWDIEGVNFEKVWKYCSEAVTPHNDVPYSREDIQKMVFKASPRDRAIILLMVSSGCRIGALSELKIRDLVDVPGFSGYKVRVYSDSLKHHYTTFCSPEARRALEAYLTERRNKRGWVCKGSKRVKPMEPEVINGESPVFRLEKNTVIPMPAVTLMKTLTALAESVGLRPRIDKSQRHKTPATHSFRKIANTAFHKAGVKPVVVEMLLGHKTGLQQNYLRLTDEELLAEYVKALDLLTIGNEESLKKEVEELRVKAASIEELRALVTAQEKRIASIKLEIENTPEAPKEVKDRVRGMCVKATPREEQLRILREATRVLRELEGSS
jgi:integrase